MTRVLKVRRGSYQDSVSLMLVSRQIQDRLDVHSAMVAMATDLNLDLLDQMGFDRPAGASPNDMVVAIDALDDAAADAAVDALDAALAREPSRTEAGAFAEPAPRTVGAAARRVDASLALVSTPGPVAAIDAADALECGLDVMIFSDNVPVEQEVRLKERAAALGRLVMGPDCGTAVVDGVGLGFANVVRPGPVGIVVASGTGAQHLMALLDGAGIGTTQCLGVGGRDLSRQVGGRSTLAALERLAADETVTTIVVVSKPPDDEVARLITHRAAACGKQVVLGYLGRGGPDLTVTAMAVAEALGVAWTEPKRWGDHRAEAVAGDLRGLFVGGTLCDEAMLIAANTLDPVASNIPLAGQPALDASLTAHGHTFIDFGDDALTRGRPHPMIDGSLRLHRLVAELSDPTCAVVLLDVVLGHGAHPDPAAELLRPLAQSDKPVIVSVTGTRDDPQDRNETVRRLVGAGAVVHASNAAAAREAVGLIRSASAAP